MPNLFFESRHDRPAGGLFFGSAQRRKREPTDVERLTGRAEQAEELLTQTGGVPEPKPSPLERVSDILLRPSYAGAGAFEELYTTGDVREALSRAGREFFSGIGGLQGEKQTFGGVLADIGMPELGHGSSLAPFLFNDTGKGWKAKRGGPWDPTGRGAIGFALDTPLDPFTYTTFGAGRFVGIVKRGGKAVGLTRFSRKGARAIAESYADEAPEAFRYARQLAKNMGRVEPVSADLPIKRGGKIVGMRRRGPTPELGPDAYPGRIKSVTEKKLEGEWNIARRDLETVNRRLKQDPLNVQFMNEQAQAQARFAGLDQRLNALSRVEDQLTRNIRPDISKRLPGMDKISPEEAMTVARDVNLFGDEVAHQAAITRVDDMIRSGMSKYADESVVRFAGRPIVSRELFKRVGTPVSRMLRHVEELPIGAQIMSGIRRISDSRTRKSVSAGIDRLFNETAKAARDIPGVLEARSLHRAEARTFRRANAEAVAKLTKGWRKLRLTAPVMFAGRQIERVSEYAALHLDDPVRFPAEALPPAVRDVIPKLRGMTAEWFVNEARVDAIDPRAFRENYFPHMWDNTEDEMRQLTELWESRQGIPFDKRFARGPWNETRVFPSLTDGIEFAQQLKREGVINFDLKPILDATEVLARRGDSNAITMAAERFYARTLNQYGLDPHLVAEETFRRTFPEVAFKLKTLIQAEREALDAQKRNLFFGVEKAQGRIAALRAQLGVGAPGEEPQAQLDFLRQLFPTQRDVRLQKAQKTIDLATSEIARLKSLHKRSPARLRPAIERKIAAAEKRLDHGMRRLAEAEALPAGTRTEAAVDVGHLLARAQAGKPVNLAGLTPELRALYWMGRMSGVTNLRQLYGIMKRHGDEIAQLDPNIVEQVRNLIGVGRRKYLNSFNEPYKRIASGPYKGMYMPEAIADEADRLGATVLNRREFGGLLKALDLVQDVFKTYVTGPWPAFHMRNHFSNVAATFTDIGMSAFNPRRMLTVAALMAGKEVTVTTPRRRFTGAEVMELFKRFGLATPESALQERVSRGVRESVLVDNPLTRPGRHIGVEIENHAKLINFVAHLERGLDPAAAAERVHRVLFDYDQLSPFEREIMRRIFPFYTWTSKNLRVMTQQVLRHPGRVAAQLELADQDRGPEREMLPDYLRGDFKVRIHGDGKLTYVTGIDLPINSAVETAFGTSARSALNQNLSSVTPFLKILIERGTNRDLWTGKDLDERQFIGDIMGKVIGSMPEPTQRWLEFQKGDIDGEEAYSINGLKAYVLFKSYALSRVFSATAKLESDNMKAWLMDFFTSVDVREFDLSEAQERILRNRVRTWEKELVTRGVLVRGIPYLPKDSPLRPPKLPKKKHGLFMNTQ